VVAGPGPEEGGAVGEDKLGCAAHAAQLRTRRQLDVAHAIDAGRNGKRGPQARSLVDRALEHAALVVLAAWAQAEMGGIEPERADRGDRRRAACVGGCRRARGGGRERKEMAAIDKHFQAPDNFTDAERINPAG